MLGSLGSNQGVVNKQRQGTGLATVLGGEDRALDTYDFLAGQQRAKKAAKEAEMQAARDSMTKFQPDRWFKHETVIKDELNKWLEQGAQIMLNKKVDPYKSTDPESLAWRKKQIEIDGLAQASVQMQKDWDVGQKILNTAAPDEYGLATMQDRDEYYNSDLYDVVKKGKTAPPLMKAKPMLQLQDHISKLMAPINLAQKGVPLTHEDRVKIVKQTLGDPLQSEQLASSFGSLIQQMTPDRREDLDKRAREAGLSQMEQATYDYVTRYEVQRTPFNYEDWKNGALERVKVPYKEWRGADNFSKRVDEGEIMKNISTIAADSFYNDDRALKEYEKILPRSYSGQTDASYLKDATADLAKKMRNEIATQEESGVTVRGADKGDAEKSGRLWLDYMMSDNPENYNEAGAYTFLTGNVIGNMTVTGFDVIKGASSANHVNRDSYLHLKLQGNLSLDDIKKDLPDEVGNKITETVQRGTETEINIPITPQTENWLLAIHDKRLKQTGIPFTGAHRTTPQVPKKTIGQMGQGQAVGQSQPEQKPKQTFNF